MTPETILDILRGWNMETKDPRNDGWVQQAFEEKLKKVGTFFESKHLDEALSVLPQNEYQCLLSFEDEIELYENYGGD